MFTESKVIKQITILPQSGGVNVQWANVVKKNDEVISETFERKAYDASLAGFNTEVGALDVNAFLAAFNAATLDAKVEALASKALAESHLALAIADKDAAIAAAVAPLEAQIATLQAQVTALTPAPAVADPLGPIVDDLQIRLAMNQVGLRTAVEAAVASSEDQSLKDWYERAKKFKRHDPLVIGMVQSLGVSDEDVDGLWALAATL